MAVNVTQNHRTSRFFVWFFFPARSVRMTLPAVLQTDALPTNHGRSEDRGSPGSRREREEEDISLDISSGVRKGQNSGGPQLVTSSRSPAHLIAGLPAPAPPHPSADRCCGEWQKVCTCVRVCCQHASIFLKLGRNRKPGLFLFLFPVSSLFLL